MRESHARCVSLGRSAGLRKWRLRFIALLNKAMWLQTLASIVFMFNVAARSARMIDSVHLSLNKFQQFLNIIKVLTFVYTQVGFSIARIKMRPFSLSVSVIDGVCVCVCARLGQQ